MQKIFLTGGTGFIGKHVLNKLIQAGTYSITVLTRSRAQPRNNVTYVRGHLADKDLLKESIAQSDYVIHLAGCKKNPTAFYSTNITGTENIIAACDNDKLRKLIYLSSVGVTGSSSEIEIRETTACSPQNDYEKSKYQAELLVRRFSAKKPGKTVILRPTNVFGEDDAELHLLNLINKIRQHRFYYIGNDISKYYLNYLYVREISELIPQFLHIRSSIKDMYIINTPTPLSEFITTIKEILKDDEPVLSLHYLPIKVLALCFDHVPKRILKHPPVNSLKLSELTNKKIYSNALLMEDLKWHPAFTLKQALNNLISHYRELKLLP